MNWGKVISIHFVRKKFPSFQVINYLSTRYIYCKKNYAYLTDSYRMIIHEICHGVDIYKLVKRMALVNISSKVSVINEYFKIPIFIIDEN